ncbi:MAG TPA: hypothetical protein PKK94_08540 [Leptospiraceae bacterium]|nr:hypothetical protein [Leptospiraceae bacterium]HNO23012.1 hypothetical protein [Leptospiraceae bacterium]
MLGRLAKQEYTTGADLAEMKPAVLSISGTDAEGGGRKTGPT